jgi:UrcA family protein
MLKAFTAGAAVAVASALLFPTASLASTARAASEEAAQTATVSYADLNLASPKEARVLQGRIKLAAADVCGRARPVELAELSASRQCMDGAIASAKPAYDEAIAAASRGSVTVIQGASLIVTAPGL